jgi:hypothetical protein
MVTPRCLERIGRNEFGFGALDSELEHSMPPAMEPLPRLLFFAISSEEEVARPSVSQCASQIRNKKNVLVILILAHHLPTDDLHLMIAVDLV